MPRRRGVAPGAIVAIVGLVVLVVFMIQNTETVRVHFLAWHSDWAVWVLVLITTLIGAVAWFGIGVARQYRRGR